MYAQYVMEQLSSAKERCSDPIVLIEQHLDFSQWVPEGFGTGDCVIVADETLTVIDFKYGVGILVDAESTACLSGITNHLHFSKECFIILHIHI